MTVHEYRAGGWTAIVADDAVALLHPAVAAEVAREVWQLASAGRSLGDWVEYLAGAGIAALPSFAMVEARDNALRVLVRGDVDVVAAGRSVTARGYATWREEVLEDVGEVTLSAQQGSGPWLPLTGGIVGADALRFWPARPDETEALRLADDEEEDVELTVARMPALAALTGTSTQNQAQTSPPVVEDDRAQAPSPVVAVGEDRAEAPSPGAAEEDDRAEAPSPAVADQEPVAKDPVAKEAKAKDPLAEALAAMAALIPGAGAAAAKPGDDDAGDAESGDEGAGVAESAPETPEASDGASAGGEPATGDDAAGDDAFADDGAATAGVVARDDAMGPDAAADAAASEPAADAAADAPAATRDNEAGADADADAIAADAAADAIAGDADADADVAAADNADAPADAALADDVVADDEDVEDSDDYDHLLWSTEQLQERAVRDTAAAEGAAQDAPASQEDPAPGASSGATDAGESHDLEATRAPDPEPDWAGDAGAPAAAEDTGAIPAVGSVPWASADPVEQVEPSGIIDSVPGRLRPAPPAATPPVSGAPPPPGQAPQAPPIGRPVDLPPPAGAQPGPAAGVEDPSDEGDHDGETILASGLPANDVPIAEDPVVAPAPSVELVLSTGPRIELTRPVLLGRAPEASRFVGSEAPRLVSVPNPEKDISGTHVEVRPAGSHVVVTDMNSTNGTVVTLPDQPAFRLQPGTGVPVAAGAVIELGAGVSVRVALVGEPS